MSEVLSIKSYFTPLSQFVRIEDPVWMAWRLMKEHQVKYLPVLKGDRIIGIVSDRDIVQISGFNGGQSMPVKDAMSLDPLILSVSTSVHEAVEAMLRKDQHHGVVVNIQGEPCGLFAWNQAFEWFLDSLHGEILTKSAAR